MSSDFFSEPKGVLALFFPFTLPLYGLKLNVTPNLLTALQVEGRKE